MLDRSRHFVTRLHLIVISAGWQFGIVIKNGRSDTSQIEKVEASAWARLLYI